MEHINKFNNKNRRAFITTQSVKKLKKHFKARAVYLSRDDRIQAHFTTCFLALVLYRYLEKYLGESFTSNEIISSLHGLPEFLYLTSVKDRMIHQNKKKTKITFP